MGFVLTAMTRVCGQFIYRIQLAGGTPKREAKI
jgi:hypothetical protein